jgi:putative hydroxymethylpyrimidine transport system substrate-binding protein
MKLCFPLVALAFVALLLPGCGAGAGRNEASAGGLTQLRNVKVALDGRSGPETAGIAMATKRGYFREAGLDVLIISPNMPNRPATDVADRFDDFGVLQRPQLTLAREKGMPIVAIGTLIPEPTAAMIWLKGSPIHGIADLEGKTVGIAGVAFETPFLESVLARAGLSSADVTVKKMGYELVPALLEGRVDAIFGGSWNVEGVELESRHAEPVVRRLPP